MLEIAKRRALPVTFHDRQRQSRHGTSAPHATTGSEDACTRAKLYGAVTGSTSGENKGIHPILAPKKLGFQRRRLLPSKHSWAMASNDEQQPLHILFFPFVAPGHLIPVADMAAIFSSHGVKCTILTTPMNAAVICSPVDRAKTTPSAAPSPRRSTSPLSPSPTSDCRRASRAS
ncbi:scopoletin glucosyltransferase-like [Panicum miliaceum]|uniref:Scopoletin glucosyltransferase-like n=1 Tax=Panicum miliaceum TaxID=4540 RepID=A0A3L6SZE2_PANMI|nr:scopoletin glucosyltransferase-like [Panicum miliaceum]